MMMKKSLRQVAAVFAALLCTAAASYISVNEPSSFDDRPEVEQRFFSPKPLTTQRRLLSGNFVRLSAFRLIANGGRRPLWASLGRPSLARVSPSSPIFRPSPTGGFTVQLLLRDPADDDALAAAASAAESRPVSACQILRVPPARLTCKAAVRLPEGFSVEVTGWSFLNQAHQRGLSPSTALVVFNSLGGVWSPEALRDLEQRGEIFCRLTVLRPVGGGQRPAVLLASGFRLRVDDAVDLTPGLLLAAAAPTPTCRQRGSRSSIDLVAAYNFRSSRRVANLAPGSGGRYQVLGRGRVNFTLDGVELQGRSWIDIDTEGGSLTEHMRFSSKWSVFFTFRTSASSRQHRASLFSVHANNNPMACSILAWTTAGTSSSSWQDAVYTRQHNLAGGYAVAQTTQPMLHSRPGAWNRVGIASDVNGRQTVYINGAVALSAAEYRFPDKRAASAEQQAALRHTLSVGLVRGPSHAMLGTFRCFGVARGALSAEQFHDAFATYCQ